MNDDEYDDGEEDSSDVGANTNGKIGSKEEVEMRTTKPTTTTCPFQRLGLHPNLVSALTSPDGHFRLSQPTIVQSRSISVLLPKSNSNNNSKKKKHGTKLEQNLFIQSETGSGKTLAYLVPILQHLAVDNSTPTTTPQQSLKRIDRQLGGTRVILLCPTRELSTQTYTIAQQLCTSAFPWIIPGCFSGGEKRKSEKARLRKGITILIATPGRLLDHLSKTECLLSALKNKLEWIILDEADRLLDAGLGGQVSQIVQHIRSNQPRAGPRRDGVTWRSVLVSATVNGEIMEGLVKTVLGGEGWMWARGHNRKSEQMEQSKGKIDEDDAEFRSSSSSSCALTQANDGSNNNESSLDNAAPRQLAQLYMIVSAKLRLSSLIAFLAVRASRGERTIVFLSTCDSVDYHHLLFTSMESISGEDKGDEPEIENDESSDSGGVFGTACSMYKLHGDIPHNKRLSTLKAFTSTNNNQQRSSILLATDGE